MGLRPLYRFTFPRLLASAAGRILAAGVGMIWNPLKLLAHYRSAKVTAEALAWHHGSYGVAMARSAAEGPHGSPGEAFQSRLVANLAEYRYDCLKSCDTATRYHLGESWSRRRGQMIR